MSGHTRREKERSRRRKQILTAARSVFSRKGYHNATLDDIARKAELGKGTIYWYFSGKGELFMAVLRSVAEEGFKRAQRAAEKARSCRSRIEAIAREQLKHFERNQFLIRILSSEPVFATQQMKSEMNRFVSERQKLDCELIEGVLKEGMNNGEIKRVDVRRMSGMLLGIFHSSVYYWLFEGIKPRPEEDARMMCKIIFEGLKR
jgi:AcrR family transcriptional regulator